MHDSLPADRRLVINVRAADTAPLERRARENMRPLRDEAAWLVHWALEQLEREDEPLEEGVA